MYLSKLTLDPTHPAARRDLADAYEMHRTLTRAFVDSPQAQPARFLWRLERVPHQRAASTVLVQSENPGNWQPIRSLSGYATGLAENKPVNLTSLIEQGARYRFRLQANPTVTREGKRVGLVGETEQLLWLERQAQRAGVTLESSARTGIDRLCVKQGRTGRAITLQSALFEGALRVQEPELLRASVLTGLGHGKAFGLGLLSLARLL